MEQQTSRIGITPHCFFARFIDRSNAARGKLFVRLKEDGESIVVRIDKADRALRLQADPRAFYITDHYVAYPWMLARLSAVALDDLADIIRDAWRLRAPGRVAVQYDEGQRS